MTSIHILAGLLSLLSGAVAFAAAKGSLVHKVSGRVFAISMLVMTGSAVIIATWLRPNVGNIVAGLLTFYLVVTGVLTMRQPLAHGRGLAVGLMLTAVCVGTFAFVLAFVALQLPRGMIDAIPAAPLFLFGAIGWLAAVMDARMLWKGGITGAHRVARHLWRMGFAMWIATTSAFLGQAKFIPEPLRQLPLLAIPVLLVTVLIFYYLFRTLRRRTARPAAIRREAPNRVAYVPE